MPEGQVRLPQRDSPLLFALYFLAYLSVLIRLVLRPESEGVVGATAYGLMAAFLAFSVAQPPLSRRWPAWTHLNLALQCAVVIALFMTEPTIDFYGILCIALSIVAVRDLEAAASLVWLVILCVTVTLGLIVAFGPLEALNYITVYVVGCLLFGLYGRVSRKAESARARSEALLAELADAHRRLREYAERAEEAAAAQERAHLAGELHDAATQTVFSMNLTAEAARIASREDPPRVPAVLDRLRDWRVTRFRRCGRSSASCGRLRWRTRAS